MLYRDLDLKDQKEKMVSEFLSTYNRFDYHLKIIVIMLLL